MDVEAFQTGPGVQDFEQGAVGGADVAGVADLATGFGVEGRAVHDDFEGSYGWPIWRDYHRSGFMIYGLARPR
ncbi:hypothetical protein GCM10010404_91990 [Nonomuraea africana]|uniref:Uncharacterized protein n=1 Tax=Nonomuraea africana TaxID=46171 RepID=A0ABR9K6P8_9ACTN|nr:hypothetical protein [Nonomuraea africana]MBE1557689.1 hypothetical protein [Nonomuraea africana]